MVYLHDDGLSAANTAERSGRNAQAFMSIREEAEDERQKLKNMTWRDRTWHVWECASVPPPGCGSGHRGPKHHRHLDMPPDLLPPACLLTIINDRSGGAGSSAQLESDLRKYLGCGKKDLIEINEGLMVDF
ncbi:MAG: hypothetical protein ACLR0U_32720 [Enterocloster clostridioformis]